MAHFHDIHLRFGDLSRSALHTRAMAELPSPSFHTISLILLNRFPNSVCRTSEIIRYYAFSLICFLVEGLGHALAISATSVLSGPAAITSKHTSGFVSLFCDFQLSEYES